MHKKLNSDTILDKVNILFLIAFMIVMIYPLYFTIIASVSDPKAVVDGQVYLLPKVFSLDAYKNIIAEKKIWTGYANTIFYTVVGTLFNLILTLPAAYALSKKELVGRNLISIYVLFPMYFSGGLIPYYLLIKQLGLFNSLWTIIMVEGLSIYNLIVTRVYFQSTIPGELYESARIEGARETRMFLQIALPLAKPIIAIMTLFYAVGHWNSYFNALLYITKQSLQPLQIVLRNILLLNQQMSDAINAFTIQDPEVLLDMARRAYLAESMKYALIFIASAPLLIAYPFVQKHFVKGVLIGSLKG